MGIQPHEKTGRLGIVVQAKAVHILTSYFQLFHPQGDNICQGTPLHNTAMLAGLTSPNSPSSSAWGLNWLIGFN